LFHQLEVFKTVTLSKNKFDLRDDEDALCLAATYFDDREATTVGLALWIYMGISVT
jgi:hypothetical protein